MEERAFGLAAAGSCPALLPAICLSPAATGGTPDGGAGHADGHADAALPGLPETLRKRQLPVAGLLDVVSRAKRYGGWLERFAHPRFPSLTGDRAARIIGALLIVPCLSILVPLPLTNTVPGIGVALVAVGLIERDALFVVMGLIAAIDLGCHSGHRWTRR
jgi:hypothetical protein